MSGIFNGIRSLDDHKTNLVAQKKNGGSLFSSPVDTPVFVPGEGVRTPEGLMNFVMTMMALMLNTAVSSVKRGAALMSMLCAGSDKTSMIFSKHATDQDTRYIIYMASGLTKDGRDLVISNRGNIDTMMTKWVKEQSDGSPVGDVFASESAMARLYNGNAEDISETTISTIIMQVWILLTKAMTNPDNADNSFEARFKKYHEGSKIRAELKFSKRTREIIVNLLRARQGVRHFMVNILIDLQGIGHSGSRLEKLISDIGSYLEDAGLGSFINTMRYGIKPRHTILANSQLRHDLDKIEQLIILYKAKGPTAPFMILLDDPDQTKFSPGNYPMLWSFAMGVAVASNKDMQAMVFSRTFLDRSWFEIGQALVLEHQGTFNKDLMAELGASDADADLAKELIKKHTAGLSVNLSGPSSVVARGAEETGNASAKEDNQDGARSNVYVPRNRYPLTDPTKRTYRFNPEEGYQAGGTSGTPRTKKGGKGSPGSKNWLGASDDSEDDIGDIFATHGTDAQALQEF